MLYFETERLIMRPWSMDDFDAFFDMDKNPDVGPDAGWAPVTDAGRCREILSDFCGKPDELCAVTLREGGLPIGSLGLHIDAKRDEALRGVTRMLGYALNSPYWGKGYMTEAARGALRFGFDKLGLELISVWHFPSNDRSRRVIEKCGFIREGVMRQACLRYDGLLLDETIYSMTRDEFYVRYGL